MQLIPTEHNEAVAVAQYLDILQRQGRIELYSHIPHETFTKNWGTKMRNKREGVKKGVPDYIIVTKKSVLFLELKRIKGSVISIEQTTWLNALQGKITNAYVVKGYQEAKGIIDEYLG